MPFTVLQCVNKDIIIIFICTVHWCLALYLYILYITNIIYITKHRIGIYD